MRDFRWNLLPAAVISRCIFKKQDFNMPRPLHNLSLIDLDVGTSKYFISFEKRSILLQKMGVNICHHTKHAINALQHKNKTIVLTGFDLIRSGCRTAATSKMELFVIIVTGFQPLNIITESSTLDVAAVLDFVVIKCKSQHCFF